jgi:hypothetical protein
MYVTTIGFGDVLANVSLIAPLPFAAGLEMPAIAALDHVKLVPTVALVGL